MKYRVTIYCPDQHLLYEGRTPDEQGVGGGVTARIRLAQALVRLGHEVSVIANVPRCHVYAGVRFQPLAETGGIDTDILVLNTTGGRLDLSPVLGLQVKNRWREVWIGGVSPVGGLEEVNYDLLIVPSNFIHGVVRDQWRVPAHRIFVAYNGFQNYKKRFRLRPNPRRNLYRLVYTGHPSKGLETARAILRLTRMEDPRFELHIFGGNRLWGGVEQEVEQEAGVFYRGLVGQRRLAEELKQSSVLLSLQSIPEAFGISVVEAMAAGNLVIASPVGALGEIIRDGHDGFLVAGDHGQEDTQKRVAALILDLLRCPERAGKIRRSAMRAPMDWDTIARAWEGRWRWALEGGAEPGRAPNVDDRCICPECGGAQLRLEDGGHCTRCGKFERELKGS
ncbi:MAG: glycosyltransferase family 4 protein [Acidobacteriia bacterium]|nr:glycosyltransferase family 4 protein [Terriglobia bacterium]